MGSQPASNPTFEKAAAVERTWAARVRGSGSLSATPVASFSQALVSNSSCFALRCLGDYFRLGWFRLVLKLSLLAGVGGRCVNLLS